MNKNTLKSKWLAKATGPAKKKYKAEVIEGQPPTSVVLPPVDSGKFTTYGFERYSELTAKQQLQYDDLKGAAKLIYLEVEKWAELSPFDTEGRIWAGIKVEQLAESLNLSTKQIQRITKKNPFRTVTKRIKNRSRKLIRVGHPADLTNEDFARIMVHDWKHATGRTPSPKHFGELVGMVKDSPHGLAPDIFRTVTANWSSFMAGVHLAIAIGEVEGDYFDKDQSKFSKKFFNYANISVMRRFWPVAIEQYHMFIQENMSEGPIFYNNINKIILKHNIQSPF